MTTANALNDALTLTPDLIIMTSLYRKSLDPVGLQTETFVVTTNLLVSPKCRGSTRFDPSSF